MLNFNENDIRRQFLAFMSGLDIQPYDENSLVIDGKLHRYRTHDDKSSHQSGAYCIYPEGMPAGFAQDWRKGVKATWRYDISGLDDERKTYYNSEEFKNKAEQERREANEKRRYEKLARSEAAAQLWDTFRAASDNHPYLLAKHIQNHELRYNPHMKALCVPLREISGRIMSIQWIPDDLSKHKTFFEGAALDGAFWSIGLDGADFLGFILLGEGYATMAKIYELTGYPCAAAMSCYRLYEIAEVLHSAYPNCKIIICADNDLNTELERGYNPGIREAKSVINRGLAHGLVYPEFVRGTDGTDWDDYAIRYGDKYTAEVLQGKIQYEYMSDAEKAEYRAVKELETLVVELDKNRQIPPEDYIAGIFPRKRISAVIAAPGTGKTWFLQRTVSDLSCGGAIYDGFAEEPTPLVSVVFAGEAGSDIMIRRAAATNWAVKKKNVKIYGMIDAEKKGLSLMLDEDDGKQNIERIIKLHRPDIVFFDTLGSFHNSDENKADEMKPILRWLLVIAERYNTAIVLMHHARKMQGKEVGRALTQDDTIGSSIFNRLVSLIISIEPTKEEESVLLVKSLKSWFSKFMPFTYKLTQDGDEHTKMVIDLAPSVVTEISRTKVDLELMLHDLFEPNQWFKASDVPLVALEITSRQLRRLLNDFVNSKKLKKRGERKGTEYALTR